MTKKRRRLGLIAGVCIMAVCMTAGLFLMSGMRSPRAEEKTERQILYGNLIKQQQLFTFESEQELQSLVFEGNVAKAELVSAIENAPLHVSQGEKCLQLRRALVSCSECMSVALRLEQTTDFTEMPIVSFTVNSFGGEPGANLYYIKLTARAENATYEKVFGYNANAWNVINFDLSGFDGKNAVSSFGAEFFSDSNSEVAWEGNFQIDNIFAGKMQDFRFALSQDTQGFTAEGATLTAEDDCLVATATGNGTVVISSPDRRYTAVLSSLYSNAAEIKNSIYTVLDNRSSAETMRIRFKTSGGGYASGGNETISIEPNAKKLYKVNFSDNSAWNANVDGFRYEFEGVRAGEKIYIDSIELHEDETIVSYAGKVETVKASKDKTELAVSGYVAREQYELYSGGTLELYAGYIGQSFAQTVISEPIASLPLSMLTLLNGKYVFSFGGVDMVKNGNKTYIDGYFTVAVSKQGQRMPVDKARGIDNIEDFLEGKYLFENPSTVSDVLQKGAKGDGFTDDTAAIQKAIDDLSAAGGGIVLLGGERSYIATHIMLKDNITLQIEEGSELRQSEDFRHYDYDFELGHNSVAYSYVNWAHCNVVSNYPLIHAQGANNIKVTGKGSIVMSDADNYGDDLLVNEQALEYHYSVCSRRLHVMPIGFNQCKNVEVSGISILKSSGYHMGIYYSENVTVYGVEMTRVKCVSSDGISLQGSRNIEINGIYLNGNDDGVVLIANYNDPRKFWFWCIPGEYQATHNVSVYNSYVVSGGGKAISLITWGSDDPNQEHQEIKNITVMDCTLSGGYSIGVWPDNPYNGKLPFDNSELDDWSPIKDLTALYNDYLSPVNVYPVKVTGLVTDADIVGTSELQNGEFEQGELYWTLSGGAAIEKESGDRIAKVSGDGAIDQGLYLPRGEYLFRMAVKANGSGTTAYVKSAATGEEIVGHEIMNTGWEYLYLYCVIEESDTYRIGVSSRKGVFVWLDSVSFTFETFENAESSVPVKEIYAEMERQPEGVIFDSSTWSVRTEDGNGILKQTNNSTLTRMVTEYDGYEVLNVQADIRFDSFNVGDDTVAFAVRYSANAMYNVYFSRARGCVGIRRDKNGEFDLAKKPFAVQTGKWYHVEIVCVTEDNAVKISFSVDRETVCMASESQDMIAAGAFSVSCYNAAITLDNLYVSTELSADAAKHKVTFVDKAGNTYSVYVEDGGTATVPQTIPDAEGYVVSGYDSPLTQINRDKIIRILYVPKKVNVTFRGEDGEILCSDTVDYNGLVRPPEMPIKDGYDFVGFDKPLGNITADTVFSAIYKKKSYEVVFFDYYGNRISVQDIAAGDGARAPVLLSDGNHNFKGWEGGFDSIYSYTEVYAKINPPDKIDITFVDTLLGETQIVTLNKEGGNSVTAPVCLGYKFEGWYYDAEGTARCDLATAAFEGNTWLYAKWTKEDLSATGGTVQPAKPNGANGRMIALIVCVCVLAGGIGTVGVIVFKKKKRADI